MKKQVFYFNNFLLLLLLAAMTLFVFPTQGLAQTKTLDADTAELTSIETKKMNTSPKVKKEPHEISEEFMKIFIEKGYAKMMDKAYRDNLWFDKDELEAKKLSGEKNFSTKQIGKIFGYEYLNNTMYFNNIYIISYLVRAERMPLLFKFILYKADGEWTIYSHIFGDQIIEEANDLDEYNRKFQTNTQ